MLGGLKAIVTNFAGVAGQVRTRARPAAHGRASITTAPRGDVLLRQACAHGAWRRRRIAALQVSGPVAIVAAGADIAKTDAAGLFQFCAIVNINLAVVNLLPLPALDGGYLLLLAVEAARGKKLPEQVEQVGKRGEARAAAFSGGVVVRSGPPAHCGACVVVGGAQGFMASGFLLLMAMGFSLVVKDTINLLP